MNTKKYEFKHVFGVLFLSLLIILSLFCVRSYASDISISGNSSNGYVNSMVADPFLSGNGALGEYEPNPSMVSFNESFDPQTTYYTGLVFSNSNSYGGFLITLDESKLINNDSEKMWLRIGTQLDFGNGSTSDKEITGNVVEAKNFAGLISLENDSDIYIIIGPKYDSDGTGGINYMDAFESEKCDVYIFHCAATPGITSISLSDSDISPAFNGNSYARDYRFSTSADSVTPSIYCPETDYANVRVVINGNEYTLTKKGRVKNLPELTLSSFLNPETKDIVIPIKVIYANNDQSVIKEDVYTLSMNIATPVILEHPQNVICDKDEAVTLSVSVQAREGDSISYQWLKHGAVIEGATDRTYVPPTDRAGSSVYSCRVTNTVDGEAYIAVSNEATVTVNLSYVSPPLIGRQPGTFTCENVTGSGWVLKDYPSSFSYGNDFDAWIGLDVEAGTQISDIKLFYNDTASINGATELEISWTSRWSSDYSYFECITPSLPEGEWYVYAVVTATASNDSALEAATASSDFFVVVYDEFDVPLEGSGTQEDPFQLKSEADFIIIRNAVNEMGITFSGVYFKMMNDIQLSDAWYPIGVETEDPDNPARPFSGTLDGGGFTLSYSKGSLPLFNFVNNATIQNMKLYGEEIDGSGLINKAYRVYGVTGATIDGVTLLSGMSTKKSGLLNYTVTYTNPYIIKNCIAEEGVIIGYDKTEGSIGTFAGGMVGSVDNCDSAATVYGVGPVGGIVGGASNSVGKLQITNCTFTGVVDASGTYVGGIVGLGYYADSAPNAFCMTIDDNIVTGTVKGDGSVGGIIGAEVVDQCWDNGIGYVRNNSFTGTVSGASKVGGIAGTYRSLNRYTIIENNYYSKDCGATSGFGFVAHVDTNAIEFGMHDGVMYYSTENLDYPDFPDYLWKQKYTEEQWEEINYVVEVEPGWRDMGRWVDSSITKADHNRTDDPLGADAEKLCYTDKVEEIVVSKTPEKTEYIVGEELDLAGLVVEAVWNTEKENTELSLDELEVEGFDSSKPGEQTVTVSYGDFTASFTVTVKEVEYEYLEGANSTWTAGSKDGLRFRVNMPFDKFTTVFVDGNELAKDAYEAKEGSTVVTLSKDYLNKLTAGTHELNIKASDGKAVTNFTIKPAGGSAQTGDQVDPMIWIVMVVAFAMGIAALPNFTKKRRVRG